MDTLTLAKLLEKTDFYHHLDQISEELKMDYEEILDGLEEMADRGIHLNLDYLKDTKLKSFLSEKQAGRFYNIYSKSMQNKPSRFRKSEVEDDEHYPFEATKLKQKSQLAHEIGESTQTGMSLAEMEEQYGLRRNQIYRFLEIDAFSGDEIQLDYLIAELENEKKHLEAIREALKSGEIKNCEKWNLYLEWIDRKGKLQKYVFIKDLISLCNLLEIPYHPDMTQEELKAETFLKLRSGKCRKVQSIQIFSTPNEAINFYQSRGGCQSGINLIHHFN